MVKQPAKKAAPAPVKKAPARKTAAAKKSVAVEHSEPVALVDENSAFYPNGQIKPFLPIAPAPITDAKSIEHHHRLIHPEWFPEKERLPFVNTDGSPKDKK